MSGEAVCAILLSISTCIWGLLRLFVGTDGETVWETEMGRGAYGVFAIFFTFLISRKNNMA